MAAASEAPVVTPLRPGAGESSADKQTIARGGLLTMAGSMYAGVAGFALTLLVGSLFGAHQAGIFFEAVAIWTILNGIAVLGADTGLLRMVSGRRSLHAHEDVWATVRVTAVPVLVWSALLGTALWLASGPVASALLADDAEVLQTHLRVVAVTLVFSAFGQAALVGSRGFGDLRPYILAYQVGLSTARVALIAAMALATGGNGGLLVLVWALPLVVMDLGVVWYVVRRAADERTRCAEPLPPTPARQLAGEVWRFNVPRGFASFFETCIVWVDVLIVGYFLGPAMAGAYAAASRFVTTGTMAMEAMRVGSAPTIAAAYAQQAHGRANRAYQLSSIWLVLLSWPWFFLLATFAPLVLGWIGEDFVVAADGLSVMALGILFYLLMGNINAVVLMAGHSGLTATNTFFTLLVNIGLNLVLVPAYGLVGAAIAWSFSLGLDSVLCLVRGHRHTGAVPPYRGLLVAAAVCAGSFGLLGLVVRLVGEQSIGWLALHALAGVAAYVGLIWANRRALHLEDLPEMIGGRR
ncbi:polysaccharide biosynthesis C-terminal domain-containing protein [Nocardioides panacisoli]|uniref:MATE family efflux transporter n=1 Tax=Nocardioides panacisoli TaxID=627624 RepID=UPI001C6313BA|nr:polysaccharide biosynthesis C-terminal domain-containing protein [Nocardioides panacisoli]QYJ02975.1 polysaccharide biosynthesis C-terminal domain-containing protein [Nocardioides panacisoli]